jgi:ATPase subunit of ABC transporter with duplicated ATPase domains
MLKGTDLTKSHDGAPLFDGVSRILDDCARAGLVGVNGIGKTTLLRLLAGLDRPDRGAGRVGARGAAGRRAGGSGIEHLDRRAPLGRVSGGEAARCLLAAVLLGAPTVHLDFDTLEVIEAALRAYRGTLVIASHDRALLEAVRCDRVIEVRDGAVQAVARLQATDSGRPNSSAISS